MLLAAWAIIKQHDYLERALEIEEHHYGPDHPEVAITLTNLGVANNNLGNYTKAMDYLERALKINEQFYGPDHLKTAITLSNLADSNKNLGFYRKAKYFFTRSWKILKDFKSDRKIQVFTYYFYGIDYVGQTLLLCTLLTIQLVWKFNNTIVKFVYFILLLVHLFYIILVFYLNN